MTDFKELREALEAVPLPHEWSVCRKALNDQWYEGTTIGSSDSRHSQRVADTCRLSADAGLFAAFIAAANPATIRALLAELDAARKDVERLDWLSEHALSMDAVADPDNMTTVFYGTDPCRNAQGLTLRSAIDTALSNTKDG